MNPLKLLSTAVCCVLLSGCITVDPKAQITPLSPSQEQAAFHAPVKVALHLNKLDEDLRDELTAELKKAFDAASVRYSASADSRISVTVDELRRVSRASRTWNGQLAGRVSYKVTIEFPQGERIAVSGDLGAKYGYSQAWGAVTADGLKKIAEIVATETKKRLPQ